MYTTSENKQFERHRPSVNSSSWQCLSVVSLESTFWLYGLDIANVNLVPRALISLTLVLPHKHRVGICFKSDLYLLMSYSKTEREGPSPESIACVIRAGYFRAKKENRRVSFGNDLIFVESIAM